jgi:hypothetical protein
LALCDIEAVEEEGTLAEEGNDPMEENKPWQKGQRPPRPPKVTVEAFNSFNVGRGDVFLNLTAIDGGGVVPGLSHMSPVDACIIIDAHIAASNVILAQLDPNGDILTVAQHPKLMITAHDGTVHVYDFAAPGVDNTAPRPLLIIVGSWATQVSRVSDIALDMTQPTTVATLLALMVIREAIRSEEREHALPCSTA